ncbi:MAG TPA: cytochrome b, partial [Caulobacteraceae bacterium]
MTLHWLIAFLILTNIPLAWYFNTLHGLAKVGPTQIHKSIGITVLALSVLRLGWRFVAPHPPLPASVTGWERAAAYTVYALFYVVMIGMPLTGWAMVSASKLITVYPITWFGLFQVPAIGPLTTLPAEQMHQAKHFFENAHGLGAKLAYALIVLHVGAALRHQFIKRDGVVWRMLPFMRRPA